MVFLSIYIYKKIKYKDKYMKEFFMTHLQCHIYSYTKS